MSAADILQNHEDGPKVTGRLKGKARKTTKGDNAR